MVSGLIDAEQGARLTILDLQLSLAELGNQTRRRLGRLAKQSLGLWDLVLDVVHSGEGDLTGDKVTPSVRVLHRSLGKFRSLARHQRRLNVRHPSFESLAKPEGDKGLTLA